MTRISGHKGFRATTRAATLAAATALGLATVGPTAGAAGLSLTFEPIAFPMSVAEKSDIDRIADPDNLTYLPGSGVLIIAEDSSNHEIDMIGAYDVADGGLTRIQSTPYGSETTAAYWYPDINGWGYLSSIVQDPFGDAKDMPEGVMAQIPADATRSSVGVIGPFPALSN